MGTYEEEDSYDAGNTNAGDSDYKYSNDVGSDEPEEPSETEG